MKTRITELLGIAYPIFQGGMAWVAEHSLAAAVSEAGGLGIIGAASAPAEVVREEIRKARELTKKPIGVNIMLMNPNAPEVAKVVLEEGTESGGHIGSITTMCLVPQVVDAVQIPVIAAGGICDGRGFAAARMLGAEAVQMGTRFIVAKESIVHQNFKEKVIKAKDIDSEVTGASTGHPVRQIRNQMSREYLRLEKEGAGLEELEQLTLGSLRRAVMDGDTVTGTLMAGQIAGLVKKEQSCKEIIEEIMQEAGILFAKAGREA